MKIIYNDVLPTKEYIAINIFNIIFARKKMRAYPDSIKNVIINHELIHTEQIKELFYIPFYVLYLCNYIYNLFIYKNHKDAHRNIYFEKEAYDNETNLDYIKTRKKYNYFKL